ncbi:MAG TPA: class I SAM-dependent methyltransferase [Rhodocyclaceae bacterium]|nr:class I SAM-dependent methyltransferase [Rhodocyclaceae bacterium]
MHSYWNLLIAPLFQALRPARVVEIGALDGGNTRNILTAMPDDGMLHVIDPCPGADVAAMNSERLQLHRGLSLDVLPTLSSFDLGIVDGDHNWYTVRNELRLIDELHAGRADEFPLLIFHDTGWPYGRRDNYFDPSAIPASFRHPHAAAGMIPNQRELSAWAGLNPTIQNAAMEGGERNGVLTAIEDFIADSGREFIFRTLPINFGYGFLLSAERARRQPEVLAALDGLFSADNLLRLLTQLETNKVELHAQHHALSNRLLSLRQRKERAPWQRVGSKEKASISPIKLSVIVVVHDMGREAPRCLHALSRDYQRGIEDLDYEVIVVDNGSRAPLGKDLVEAFGNHFSYHYLDDAGASPAAALNFGASKARGEFLCLMVDGAHILTPGVLHYAARAFEQFAEPLVAVRYWYLGPGQQPVTCQQGYNATQEDVLLAQAQWPDNGYGLFLIGEEIGDQRNAWLRALFESNCLFLRKHVFNAIGGADERFDLPGGGFLNADIYREAAEYGETQTVVLLGEATFHQVHGGTTTNAAPEDAQRLIDRYRRQYREIRGEDHALPRTRIEYLGHLPLEARQAGRLVEPLRARFTPPAKQAD